MRKYKGYLLDLDGTVYKGGKPFPEAVEFVQTLNKLSIPYLFVTNNSTTSPGNVAARLTKLGIPCENSQVLTSSLAAASYIKERSVKQSAYIIGEEGLKEILEKHDIREEEEEPGFVVVGLDRSLTYKKLEKACLAIRAGAHFLSTNQDAVLPTEQGLSPGNGAISAAITTATGKNPVFIGKPESIMIEQAQKKINLEKEEIVLIGDNYDTDILAGIRAGVDTIHVNTGVTTTKEVSDKEIQPTYKISSLSEWLL
ncbi:TIGR01457 family HAD-type hydrolase [Alteribacillus iranensis]|uniref:4-nitrophenyl phosphatase n=1 Tax=Alteribacillus iranensis TaxID=930128 RepID=A0A1I2EPG9_9BACI|nr:TIGR01457 family HAD-type hydrolase [Alteribacillus iranensis]SFE94735.1 4-nitrophenyl phosphatase [Alteribacillus iranensis]